MSTNVIITPAVAAAGGAVPVIVPLLLAAGAVWVVSRALAATDKEYEALLEKSRDDLRRERVGTMQLRTGDLDRLIRSAGEAQFQLTRLPEGNVRLSTGLREKVWALREPEGIRLVGHEQALSRLAAANTASRAIEHLQGRGYRIKTTTKRSGEVHISAAGQGRKVVQVVVGRAGEAKVDPKNFTGRECEGVVRDLAAAIDGTIVSFCPKPEYHNTVPIKLGGTVRG